MIYQVGQIFADFGTGDWVTVHDTKTLKNIVVKYGIYDGQSIIELNQNLTLRTKLKLILCVTRRTFNEIIDVLKEK